MGEGDWVRIRSMAVERCRERMLWEMCVSENARCCSEGGESGNGMEYSTTVFRIAVVISSREV